VWIGTSILHSALLTACAVSTLPLRWELLNLLVNLDYVRLHFIPDSLHPPSFCTAQHGWAALLDRCSSIPVGAPWPGFAPLNFVLRSSITISTPLAHPALHIRHSSFPGGTPLFPPNSSYCLSNSILIHCELNSQFQSFSYHTWSQMTLKFSFTHSPGSDHLEIQGVPPASLHH